MQHVAMVTVSGKNFRITLPAPVTVGGDELAAGVIDAGTDPKAAMDRLNAINEAYKAGALATGPAIEVLSRDGKPVDGIPTVQATDRVVFPGKEGKPGKTEAQLCDVAGFVLVSRDSTGKVKSEWGNPPDFGRYQVISAAGLVALRTLLTASSK